MKNKKVLIILLLLIVCAGALFFYEHRTKQETKEISLSEYLETGEEEWFLTGKKQYIIKAMMVSKETSFHNELEVADYTVTDDGETVVLKGTADEMWASKLAKVLKSYTRIDGSPLSEEDFAVKDEYIEIMTIPSVDEYYAMHVPADLSVSVELPSGEVLHSNLNNAPHGEGDYLVCRKGEDGKPDLSDVWILNGVLFPQNYDTSHMKK